jgi:ubiquinol-cytochrome c reductase cytochrome b subunit
VASIAILYIIPFSRRKFQRNQFYPINKLLFWSLFTIIILLTWIGARPVEDPYILVGQLLTVLYFSFYILNPLIKKIWDKIIFSN